MMNMQEAFPSVAALAPGKAIASASAEAAAVAMAGRRCARPAAPAASAAGGAFAASAPVAFASGSSLVVRSGDAASAAGEPYFRARGLGLKTYAGYVYRDEDVDARAGELFAVRGRNGSGKTALLLTLAGRMKPTEGTLSAGGLELPRQRAKVARHVGLGLFKGLNDLQDSLTAAYAASAEFELHGRRPRRDAVLAYLREWGLDDAADVRVKDLTSQKLATLGIALAFSGEPDAVVVDDVEDQLTMAQSASLVKLLREAARSRGAAVVVGVVERDLAAMADACVYLAKEGE